MPSLNLTTTQLRYASADATVLQKAITLLEVISKYDEEAKQDAATALNATQHVWEHVVAARSK